MKLLLAKFHQSGASRILAWTLVVLVLLGYATLDARVYGAVAEFFKVLSDRVTYFEFWISHDPADVTLLLWTRRNRSDPISGPLSPGPGEDSPVASHLDL